MSLKDFKRYINKCKVNGVTPTLEGAEMYKRYGIIYMKIAKQKIR